jgi:predicted transcriptional regulator
MKKQNLFNYPKLIKIIRYLYNHKANRIIDVSKKNDIQYSYICLKLKFLREIRLITTQKKGRENFVSLTDLGKNIGQKIYEIQELLKEK